MPKSSDNKKPKKTGRTRTYAEWLSEGKKYTASEPKKIITQEQSLLFDTPKIKASLFFEILEMEMPDLNLLKRNEQSEVPYENLMETWDNLREYYYSETNLKSFVKFKAKLSNVIDLKQQLASSKAGLMQIKYGDARGFENLENLGIKETDPVKIQSQINRIDTRIRLAENENKKNPSDKKEAYKYRDMVADIELNLPHQLDADEMTLEKWVNIIKSTNRKSEAQRAAYEKSKVKR